MTYTKKKISIEAEVPDGATHYDFGAIGGWQKGGWIKVVGDDLFWWDIYSEQWKYLAVTYRPRSIKPIEVIE